MSANPITLMIAARLTRTGRVLKLVQSDGSAPAPGPSTEAMLKSIARGRVWWQILCEGQMTPPKLDNTKLAKEGELPIRWNQQRAAYGVAKRA
jgi:hypothetical protein